MSSLALQQQALLLALFARPADSAIQMLYTQAHDPHGRGLKVYQANGHVLAQCALQAAYPVVEQMLGAESFAVLARALWHAQPPLRGDVAQWGGGLAEFLQASAQLQDEPYVPDVARVEWALHLASQAADAVADVPTLALLTSQEPEQLRLQLAPGTAMLRSVWPVASILGAHLHGSPTLQEAGAQLRAGMAQDALVWRQGLRSQVRLALPGEFDYMAVLLQGGTLAQALDAATNLDFGQWLPLAVQTGLLMAITTLD